MIGGCSPEREEACTQLTGCNQGSLPFRYLGVLLISNKLTKVECQALIEKIMKKVHLWFSRSISFAGRAQLINTVIFGMFTYWGSIFLLPQVVTDQLTRICMNYLWGGKADYVKVPYVSWHTICFHKKSGGLGIKNFRLWNIACITKLIWQIAQKKDNLWIKWIHARYLKSQNWRTYTPPSECSWYWRKILWVRDSVSHGLWMAPTFSVTACYLHLLGTMATTPWASIA